ncbi:MAG: magnesium/cobalt transporter CorA [Aminivibrio sp.]|jgi:magnesium transporter
MTEESLNPGPPPENQTLIQIIRYSPGGCEETRDASPEDCARAIGSPGVTWINVDGLGNEESVHRIGELLGLHPLTVEDIFNTGQRPKAEDFGHYLFFALRMLTYDEAARTVGNRNLSVVLGEGCVVTFQDGVDGDPLKPVRERIRSGKGRIRGEGADYLAYAVMDSVVDEYFGVLEKLGDHIEDLDDRILSAPDAAHMKDLHLLKREMLFLRKAVWPLREEISALEKSDSRLVGPSVKPFLRDLYDHTIEIIDMIETNRDIVSGMHDTFLSAISNRMNEIMKVLTIIGTIFIPLTFISGIYGMNFEHMPELKWPFGYFAVLGIMAALAAAMLAAFRKRKWF